MSYSLSYQYTSSHNSELIEGEKAICYFLIWFSSCGFLAADPKEPAIRHFEGRVVKRANGHYDVTNGHWCAQFPEEKTAGFAPYLGKFVDVEFSEVENELSFSRWSFDQIQRITLNGL